MNIIDIFETEEDKGYRTEKEDGSTPRIEDLRKTKLTLAQLNKLRIMNDVRQLEHEQKLEKVKDQYSAPTESLESL